MNTPLLTSAIFLLLLASLFFKKITDRWVIFRGMFHRHQLLLISTALGGLIGEVGSHELGSAIDLSSSLTWVLDHTFAESVFYFNAALLLVVFLFAHVLFSREWIEHYGFSFLYRIRRILQHIFFDFSTGVAGISLGLQFTQGKLLHGVYFAILVLMLIDLAEFVFDWVEQNDLFNPKPLMIRTT
jgi:hypothetical protein